MKTIVVPLDGSALSERALTPAVTLAKATGAQVRLVRTLWALHSERQTREGLAPRAFEDAERYLEGIVRRLAEDGVRGTIAVLFAPPADGILGETEDYGGDLIVMSTHGRSGLGRWIYGSVTEAVLATSSVPVLLVRGAGPEVPLVTESGRISLLVPLDGSTTAEAALPIALRLSRELDATLALVRAVDPPNVHRLRPGHPSPNVRAASDERIEAETYLNDVAERFRRPGVRLRTEIWEGDAAAAVLESSRRAGVALVVMTTQGRTGLRRLHFGTVCANMLRHGSTPLLLVRPSTSQVTGERARVAGS